MQSKATYAGSFKNASVADKIKRMNYDIHAGAVLGLTGKIMAFFASLIAPAYRLLDLYMVGQKKKEKATPGSIKALPQNRVRVS